MHLTRATRQAVATFCCDSVYHQLLIEFTCNEKCLEENIEDTVQFYRQHDPNIDWERRFREQNTEHTAQFEPCSALEGPLITVNNSEDPMYHSVTARGVRGAIQTAILGVLASPVIRQQTFYFSRVRKLSGNNRLIVFVTSGVTEYCLLYSTVNRSTTCWDESVGMRIYHRVE